MPWFDPSTEHQFLSERWTQFLPRILRWHIAKCREGSGVLSGVLVVEFRVPDELCHFGGISRQVQNYFIFSKIWTSFLLCVVVWHKKLIDSLWKKLKSKFF